MTSQPTPPIESSKMAPSLGPEQMAQQQRALYSAISELNQEASFVAMLGMAQASMSIQSPGNILQAKAELEERLEAEADTPAKQAAEKARASENQSSANSATASTSIEPAPVSDGEKRLQELKDMDDMWVMDFKAMLPQDVKMLQNLPPYSPFAINPANPAMLSAPEQGSTTYYKSLGVSKGLQDMLTNAYKTQKPLRIDLTDTASVILRMGRDGKVSAEFLPGDQVAEMFFKQQLPELKSRLESKQLPLGELLVRSRRDQDQPQDRPRQ